VILHRTATTSPGNVYAVI